MTLKMFVWEGVLSDYTDGICCVLAESIEQAVEIIKNKAKGKDWEGTTWNILWGEISSAGELYMKPTKIFTEPNGVAIWGGG